MLDKNLSIPVYYATNKDVDATQLMKALRTKSRCISDNKIGSARPNSTSLLGSWGKNFIQKMKPNSITYNPKATAAKGV